MTYNRKSQTLIYAPEIKVEIATKSGSIDVSEDVQSFQIRRVMNAASQFSCVLNNRDQKYTGHLGRMDRVVVFLKRVTWVQVFSGYLDSVPGLSLYTTTCEIRATCTLKRLINTWWDSGLQESQFLLTQTKWEGSDPNDPYNKDKDSGMGQMLGNVLKEVGGWKSADIHIQNIPEGFMELAAAAAEKSSTQEQIDIMKRLLGVTASASSVGGITTPSGGTTAPVTPLDPSQYTETFDGNGFDAKWTSPPPPGDAVERWRPLALLAIKMMNIQANIIDLMVHRIGVESTGNPNAINLDDSNAARGTPSKGILQCIDSTFRAFAVPPYHEHIYSPLGSMLASLNYVNTDPKFTGTQLEKFQQAYDGVAGY